MRARGSTAIQLVRTPRPVEVAAEFVARALRRFSTPRLAVPGGSAAAALGPLRQALPPELWAKTRLTWVDERRVPPASPDSNRGEALRRGYLSAAQPPARELPLFEDGEDGPAALTRVRAALTADFEGGLDVLLLGLGEDGHIASLFPGHPASTAGEPVLLVDDSPKPPSERITLGLPLLSTARHTIMVAAGQTKRGAAARMLGLDPTLPSSSLCGMVLITDIDMGGSQ